jgi:hypothetical protein
MRITPNHAPCIGLIRKRIIKSASSLTHAQFTIQRLTELLAHPALSTAPQRPETHPSWTIQASLGYVNARSSLVILAWIVQLGWVSGRCGAVERAG